MKKFDPSEVLWKKKLHSIIYESDTLKGKIFDVVLLIVIVISIFTVILESVDVVDSRFHTFFYIVEWVVTILFTVEYILRIIIIKKPKLYIFSALGIIDLVSTLPMYLALFWANANSLMAIRALRLLRVFRILKLTNFIGESEVITNALKTSRHKILVFLVTVFTIV